MVFYSHHAIPLFLQQYSVGFLTGWCGERISGRTPAAPERLGYMVARTSPAAIALLAFAAAYDLGEDVTLCWLTDAPNGGSAAREDCAGASMEFVLPLLPSSLWSGQQYSVHYRMLVPSSRSPTSLIPHANVHSCVRSVGFCTPFVSNTPGLSTHSVALQGNLSASSALSNSLELTSEVKLSPDQYTIIIHGRWFDDAGRKHDMARATYVDVSSRPLALYIGASLGGVLLVLLLGILGIGVRTAIRRYRSLLAKDRLAFQHRIKRVRNVCASSDNLAYPLCAISYVDFVSHGKLVAHETARSAGHLWVFDTSEEVERMQATRDFVFVSHQWKSTPQMPTTPDPLNSDFEAIVLAMENLIRQGRTTKERAIIWVDYTSVPQRSKACQLLSIRSLPVYTSFARVFLVVAPTVSVDGRTFDLTSYQLRGWWCAKNSRAILCLHAVSTLGRCTLARTLHPRARMHAGTNTRTLGRWHPHAHASPAAHARSFRARSRLEQWARISQRGLDDMFVCDGVTPPRDVSTDLALLTVTMRFMQGEFTMSDDRHNLVDTSIALYFLLLGKAKRGKVTATLSELVHICKAQRDELFPSELYGDMLQIVEEEVEQGGATFKRQGTRRLSSQPSQAPGKARQAVLSPKLEINTKWVGKQTAKV